MTRWSRLSDTELDERLAGDLRKFTTDASRLDERWVAGTLLPVVRASIARELPERRPVPRFAGLASLATVLAVVAVVVLAIPRMIPGPAASPSAVSGVDHPSPSSATHPTNGPVSGTPEPGQASETIECPYAGPKATERPIEVAITDYAGLVVSCVASAPGLERPSEDPGSGASVSNPRGDPSQLEVFWGVSALCDVAPAKLELMSTDDGYVLVVDSLPNHEQPNVCRTALGYQGVTLELSSSIPAGDVNALLLQAGRNVSMLEIPSGRYTLSIGSDARDYSTADAIGIETQLSYGGPADGIALFGSNSGLVAFRVEQLDGDLATGPGSDYACQGYELSMDNPLKVPFAKSGGYANDDPDVDFYRRFFEEPELRLPAGIWRIYATAQFAVGECSGEQVELTASLIVRVTGGDTTAPELTATPAVGPTTGPESREFECGWGQIDPPTGDHPITTIRVNDATGAVVWCERTRGTIRPTTTDVANPLGDTSRLEVVWVGAACGGEITVGFNPAEGGYLLDFDRSRAIGCDSNAIVWTAIELQLSGPIPADRVRVSAVPAPTLSPPTTSRAIACPYETTAGRPSEVEILDHSALVSGCRGKTNRGVAATGSTVSDQGGEVLVSWPVVLDWSCRPTAVELELWSPGPTWSARYVLRVASVIAASEEPTIMPGAICDAPTGTESAYLSFSEPIEANEVDAFHTIESGTGHFRYSTVSATTDAGPFQLSLSAASAEYPVNEPITSLEASLTYEGGRQSVIVSGGGTPHLSFEQLDGDLWLVPYGSIGMTCAELELAPGVAQPGDFNLPTELIPQDPNMRFIEQYMYDGHLRLPAGTYRISGGTAFSVGPGCSGERVLLRTSIVIHVR